MAEEKLLEIQGQVDHVVYHDEKSQFTVLELLTDRREMITVVGSFPYISEGEGLIVMGTWGSHPSFGEQFKAETFQRERPATAQAILKYLASGAVRGVGQATARRIVQTFGENSLSVIENEPDRLTEIRGITEEKARAISEELKRVYGIRELTTFLTSFGARPEDAVSVWKRYGEAAVSCIQEDPYCLCDEELGISFAIADAIAQSMEYEPDNNSRVQAGVLHVLRHNLDNGHTCLPANKLISAAVGLLRVEPDAVQDAIVSLCAAFELVSVPMRGKDFFFLRKQYDYERGIAADMLSLLDSPPDPIEGAEEQIAQVERREGFQYAAKQREAIAAALEKGVLILTGGPGTGKTTTLNAIIRLLKSAGRSVLLAAPTGRAAKRMSELTGEEAKTIHRLLQVDWDEHDQPVFTRNEQNPLDCQCLVVDELSMVDCYVFYSLLKALPPGCRLILVGDSDQLPSVGAGNVLGDLIASGLFPTVQLKEIFRQSLESLIVRSAHRVVAGQMPELRRVDGDFFFLPEQDSKKAAQLIVDLCARRLPASYSYSPVSDIQVLCPGRKGELGTAALNQALREAVNPPKKGKRQVTIRGEVFRLGDKVMQVRNDYDLPWTRDDGTGGQGVFNGDMGVITDIDVPGETIQVRIDDRDVLYHFDQAGAELEPAYAVTVHKSQGNEFTAVVMPVLDPPFQLRYRNLLYTGITRAKKLLILTGKSEVLSEMIANDRKTRRYTGLSYFLSGLGSETHFSENE